MFAISRPYDRRLDRWCKQPLKLERPKSLSYVSLKETAASALTNANSLFGNVTIADDTTEIEVFTDALLIPDHVHLYQT